MEKKKEKNKVKAAAVNTPRKRTTEKSKWENFIRAARGYISFREQERQAKERMEASKKEIFSLLDSLFGPGEEVIIQRVEIDGKNYNIGRQEYTESASKKYDEQKLKKLLSEEEWEMVTDRVVKEEKIALAIAAGAIDERRIEKAIIPAKKKLRIYCREEGNLPKKIGKVIPFPGG